MVGSRRSWPPSLCHPHPWGPVRTRGGTNRVGWIPNCEDAPPPPNIGVLRFPRFAFSAFRFSASACASGSVVLVFLVLRVPECYPRPARSASLRG